MKEIKNILARYEQLKSQTSISAALAVVVRVEGSSYRRTGARMLICDDGTWVGGISGGCLEGDAFKRARLAILKAQPSLTIYDTTLDDDHQIGVGLGCNGIIEVLFIPIAFDDSQNAVEILKEAFEKQIPVVTVCKAPESPTLLGKMFLQFPDSPIEGLAGLPQIEQCLDEVRHWNKSKSFSLGCGTQLFFEVMPQPIHVYLFGHQYDIYALIRLIESLAWGLTVVAEPAKIRGGENIRCIAEVDFVPKELSKHHAAILMSHSLQNDKKNVKALLQTSVGYVGMLGPKVRTEKILKELNEEGVLITESFKNRLYAPVGLDIGANTPEEIALSIVAEIKAVFSDREGQFLRNRELPINDRDTPMFFA
jgi:xanthine dehydrogenase accessory factor